jgi:L-lactate utilization protein LutB
VEPVYQEWHYEKRAETAVRKLRHNGFEALYVPDAAAAFREVMQRIPAGACIGMGDSLTLAELGIIRALEEGGHDLLNPWQKGITRDESLHLRRRSLTADVFLTGSNAVTLDGKLVNIDGLGNRVAGMIFGPLRVIVAVGANKLVADTPQALARIKSISAPVNARRHDFAPANRPPCAETGFCMDCNVPQRICCNTVVIEGCREKGRTTVIIVGIPLGD